MTGKITLPPSVSFGPSDNANATTPATAVAATADSRRQRKVR